VGEEVVRTARDDEVLVVTLNRPDKLNALNAEVFARLAEIVDEIGQDPSIRVVVLRGEGRAFAAGADIDDYVGIEQPAYLAFVENGRRVLDGLARLRVPVIAAVRGFALGGGFELALACDLLVVAENARLGLPEARLGLMPGGGGTQRLPRLVGRMRAAEVLLAGRVLTGAEAVEWGVATRVVPKDELDAAVAELAAAIVRQAPLAVALGKRLLREGQDLPLDAAITLESHATTGLCTTADAREGVQAFVEKRDPVFRGA